MLKMFSHRRLEQFWKQNAIFEEKISSVVIIFFQSKKAVKLFGSVIDWVFLFFQSSDSEDGKGGIASFLPKDQVWKWADKGQRRSKGRVYHRIIERKEDKLDIGDSAVFLSTNCPDQPYIGRLESMWETASGTKNVGVRWYYHLAEVECSNASERQKLGRIKRPKVCILLF